MNEQVFQERFAQLLKRIHALPDDQKVGLAVPAANPKGHEAEVTRAVTELQDSLDFQEFLENPGTLEILEILEIATPGFIGFL